MSGTENGNSPLRLTPAGIRARRLARLSDTSMHARKRPPSWAQVCGRATSLPGWRGSQQVTTQAAALPRSCMACASAGGEDAIGLRWHAEQRVVHGPATRTRAGRGWRGPAPPPGAGRGLPAPAARPAPACPSGAHSGRKARPRLVPSTSVPCFVPSQSSASASRSAGMRQCDATGMRSAWGKRARISRPRAKPSISGSSRIVRMSSRCRGRAGTAVMRSMWDVEPHVGTGGPGAWPHRHPAPLRARTPAAGRARLWRTTRRMARRGCRAASSI